MNIQNKSSAYILSLLLEYLTPVQNNNVVMSITNNGLVTTMKFFKDVLQKQISETDYPCLLPSVKQHDEVEEILGRLGNMKMMCEDIIQSEESTTEGIVLAERWKAVMDAIARMNK